GGVMGLRPTGGGTREGPAFGNHLMGLTGELVLARSTRDVAAALDAAGGRAEGPFADPPIFREAVTSPLRVGVVTSAPRVSVIGLEQADAVISPAGVLQNSGHR